MILGSHNTMTYLKPRKWWMWFGKFIAKCQKRTIQEQYERGARWFDIRIAFVLNENDIHIPVFAHGVIEYKNCEIEKVLSFLNEKEAYCRIILEKGGNIEEEFFKIYVTKWMKDFPNINVTQIAKKGVWKNMLQPNASNKFPLKDCYASCNGDYPQFSNWPGILRSKTWSGYIIDDLWPYWYAKYHNKENIQKYKNENVILLIDFI